MDSIDGPDDPRFEATQAGPDGLLSAPTPGGDVPLEMLDRRVIVYWLLSGIVSYAILLGLAFGAWMLFREQMEGKQLLVVPSLALAGVWLTWVLVSPALAWNRWRFSVTDELLLARYGIIFHEEKAIPMSRLQHVDLTRGPIERLFGLATLVVFTAGTEGASFRLPGVSAARARELRDQILQARGDDVI